MAVCDVEISGTSWSVRVASSHNDGQLGLVGATKIKGNRGSYTSGHFI